MTKVWRIIRKAYWISFSGQAFRFCGMRMTAAVKAHVTASPIRI